MRNLIIHIMPPKKKQRRARSTTPQVDNPTTNASASIESPKPSSEFDLITDPWTDEQETALLKGLIRWKPVG